MFNAFSSVVVAWFMAWAAKEAPADVVARQLASSIRCIDYDPARLIKRQTAEGHWQVTDRAELSQDLINETDADQFLRVARAFRRRCLIPRGRGEFAAYWESASQAGLGEQARDEDCEPIDHSGLRLQKTGAGFGVISGLSVMSTFASEDNAKAFLEVAKKSRSHCYIGRRSAPTVPDRSRFMVQYWR